MASVNLRIMAAATMTISLLSWGVTVISASGPRTECVSKYNIVDLARNHQLTRITAIYNARSVAFTIVNIPLLNFF